MAVEARRAEMTRLCPKFPWAEEPPYTIEFRPVTPMALETASMTVFASSAAEPTDESATSIIVVADFFHIFNEALESGRPLGNICQRFRPVRREVSRARWSVTGLPASQCLGDEAAKVDNSEPEN